MSGLVPTRVGMILDGSTEGVLFITCPHTRGDDPIFNQQCDSIGSLSPHAWG